mmetsp:Transcript_27413/g.59914  ORF Transcript_27413/g.59914 Transcript_27413/m.59914 type:complete len:240 (+) Transcript_27413:840-1559(+)
MEALQQLDQEPVPHVQLILPCLQRVLPRALPGGQVVEELLLAVAAVWTVRSCPVREVLCSSLLHTPKVGFDSGSRLIQRFVVVDDAACHREGLPEGRQQRMLPGCLGPRSVGEVDEAAHVHLLTPPGRQRHVIGSVADASENLRLLAALVEEGLANGSGAEQATISSANGNINGAGTRNEAHCPQESSSVSPPQRRARDNVHEFLQHCKLGAHDLGQRHPAMAPSPMRATALATQTNRK